MSPLSPAWGLAQDVTPSEQPAADVSFADVSTYPDLDPTLSLRTGRDMLTEAIIRRLSTPQGGLFYDLDYGTDVRSLLNERIQDRDLRIIEGRVEAEAKKDERIMEADAEVAMEGAKLTIRLKLLDAAGPFVLSLTVDQLSVAQLRGG